MNFDADLLVFILFFIEFFTEFTKFIYLPPNSGFTSALVDRKKSTKIETIRANIIYIKNNNRNKIVKSGRNMHLKKNVDKSGL